MTWTSDSFLGEPEPIEDDPDPMDHSFLDDLEDLIDSLSTGDTSMTGETSITDYTSVTDDTPVEGLDPGPPYLFIDLYPLDLGPNPLWSVPVNTPGYVGAIIKAMEGTKYVDRGWFKANWPAVRDAGGDRYGVSWFRGAYLFLRFSVPGADQADAYLRAVDEAGGWDVGDVLPIIDVELGSAKNPNQDASSEQIIECTTACADRLREVTGRRAMRDRSITDHMGCDVVWNPAYTSTMVRNGLQSWDLNDIVLWQYCGDGTAAFSKLPHSVPGFGHGKVDISVYIQGAEKPDLERLRERLTD